MTNYARRAWTEEENKKLENLAGTIPPAEIARQLNRTEGAIRFQACNLGLSIRVGRKTRAAISGPVGPKVQVFIGPAAIERALSIYQQLEQHDQSVMAQARKIVIQHIYGMIDQGEYDEVQFEARSPLIFCGVRTKPSIKTSSTRDP